MRLIRAAVLVLVLCTLLPGAPHAGGTTSVVGTLVPAPDRRDMVYDAKRDVVYISAQAMILRYAVAAGGFLPPIQVGGEPMGLDLSPDGETLAIADASSSDASLWIKLVDLESLVVRRIDAPRGGCEVGTWAVAYAGDGTIVASSQTGDCSFAWMRNFRPDFGVAFLLGNGEGPTMVSATGDRQEVAFVEGGSMAGPWGRVHLADGDLVVRDAPGSGTGQRNVEVATDARGGQVAIPTPGGTFIYDADFSQVATIGTAGGPRPVAAAYDPVDQLAYFPWAQTTEVRVYDMAHLGHVGTYDVGHRFVAASEGSAFNEGRIRLSGDGSLLMVSVAGGVRIVRVFAPLAASSFAVQVPSRMKFRIPLRGSIGNGGALHYEIVEPPQLGRLTISRGVVTYARTADGQASDSFRYRVRYGRETAEGEVTLDMR